VNELVRWETEDGPIVVEVSTRDPGFSSVSRKPGEVIADAHQHFEEAMARVRAAAVSALRTFRDESLNPDEVCLEFGIKLNAAAGAVIASTSAEGHLAVTLTWTRRDAKSG
jgi:Trypsin-co-occurring domain 1